ncbi:hypothetical protein T069G_04845 [Trichoderma breve]|uniref:DUF6546 domain-containing protein n=1 Tax=Trichoderma breve TaxID=2034170 RepID=A0A9W9BAT4_9HYPO|nr:hypothetical protein T069G_04845 [Trichoderma breve]KAJ4859857.1 hypothetical protein T069G_04845 [Trichoderma breve]
MAQLFDLPLQVKHRILAYLDTSAPPNPTKFPSQSRRSELGLYASVSHEWQLFFEDRLYAHLVLTQHCLRYFNKLVPRQRQLVRYIWLRILLGNYYCSKCLGPQNQEVTSSDSEVFSKSISYLFWLLNPLDASPENDLTLEIGAYSPCDVTHAVKGDEYLSSDLVEMQDMVHSKGLPVDDLAHGWKGGQLVQSHDANDFYDIRSVLSYDLPPTHSILSAAHGVTHLIIRRTMRRFITVPLIRWILERLPDLRHFIYEPWRPLTSPSQGFVDLNHEKIISEFLPKTLKKFNWFEDFNEEAIRVCRKDGPSNELWRIGTDCHASSVALARKSISFEQLTGCYSVDAVPFFQALDFRWTWPSLTTLSLTCSLFAMPEKCDEIVTLLERVGMAAQRMPQLQTLDIWYGMRHHAAAFRHRVTDSLIIISWLGTWDLNLEAQEDGVVATAWKALARLQGNRILYIATYRPVKMEDVTSHAAAIRLLEIGRSVIHPASLEEISRETKYYFPT